MSPGRKGVVVTDGRRRLDILDVELFDRNFWAHVFGLSSKDHTSALNDVEVAISPPGIIADLIPMFTYATSQPENPC